MRRASIAAFVLLTCASAAFAQFVTPAPAPPQRPSPFQANRGSAPPPPAPAATASPQAAPPEGAGPGGIDFGAWRTADQAAYARAFATQMRARYAGRDRAAARADLEANGFRCGAGATMQCRIEVMERGCAIDWYVVLEQGRAEPVAGHDVMCLGAR